MICSNQNHSKDYLDVPKKILKFYKSISRPRQYSYIFLLSLSNQQLNRLESIQNNALRIILNKPRQELKICFRKPKFAPLKTN